MKKIYWRPQRISRVQLLLITLLALGGLLAVESIPHEVKQRHFKDKTAAARLAKRAFDEVKAERLKRTPVLDAEADPAGSGLIGSLMSAVTTNTGHLPSKQTSVNPNFAAVVVHLLKRAGVEQGDVVAVGASGSFPAINIATYAAMQTLGVKPVIISSASGSQWGANEPDFLWIDIERLLMKRGIFPFCSVAASRGGIDDRALGLSREGRKLLDLGIARNGLLAIQVKSYEESVERRMAIYEEQAGDDEIAAYINIGGGTTSVGTRVGKRMFKPGLNRTAPRGASEIDSVMTRFVRDGVPVIHLIKINRLAERYGLPLQPATMPAIGQGKIFRREEYNLWLAGGVLAAIVVVLFLFIRRDIGFRLTRGTSQDRRAKPPEPMV